MDNVIPHSEIFLLRAGTASFFPAVYGVYESTSLNNAGDVPMYVYFVIASTAYWQRIKIGRTKDVSDRIATLQVGSPTPLRLIGSIKTSSLQSSIHLEGALHRIFAAYSVGGEWFTAARPLREYIAAVCSGDEVAATIAMEWAERQMKKRARQQRIAVARRKVRGIA